MLTNAATTPPTLDTRHFNRTMAADPYIPLIEALGRVGLVAQRNLPDQLIVSAREGLVSPEGGNAFSLSYRAGLWYLSTWLPRHYRVPVNQDIFALCSACIHSRTWAMY